MAYEIIEGQPIITKTILSLSTSTFIINDIFAGTKNNLGNITTFKNTTYYISPEDTSWLNVSLNTKDSYAKSIYVTVSGLKTSTLRSAMIYLINEIDNTKTTSYITIKLSGQPIVSLTQEITFTRYTTPFLTNFSTNLSLYAGLTSTTSNLLPFYTQSENGSINTINNILFVFDNTLGSTYPTAVTIESFRLYISNNNLEYVTGSGVLMISTQLYEVLKIEKVNTLTGTSTPTPGTTYTIYYTDDNQTTPKICGEVGYITSTTTSSAGSNYAYEIYLIES